MNIRFDYQLIELNKSNNREFRILFYDYEYMYLLLR